MGSEMTRDEAESLFVQTIMKSGNPEYFVWKYVRPLHNIDLEDELSELLDGDVVEIEDED
jgi:hypothetical protein